MVGKEESNMEEKWIYKTDDQIHDPIETQSSVPNSEGVDWDDDSGAIHTVKNTYKITKEDGWQRNRGYHRNRRPVDVGGARPQMIKGTQVGMSYSTDDYRVVIPALIIMLLIMVVICVVVTILIPPMGIIFDIFMLIAVIGMIRQRPDKKWRAQAKRLKEEKERNLK